MNKKFFFITVSLMVLGVMLLNSNVNGLTWNVVDSEGYYYYSVGYSTINGGMFVAAGDGNWSKVSSDGITWNSGGYFNAALISTVSSGFTNGVPRFVAAGYMGKLFNSIDGLAWCERNSGTSNTFRGCGYGNSLYVAVGDSGTIITSPSATIWTVRNSGVTTRLYDVIYGSPSAPRFVVVGEWGKILTSGDGVTWTQRSSGTLKFIYDVAYGNGRFAAVGQDGSVLTSTNGINWTSRTSGTTTQLYTVTYGNGLFVAAGLDGTIISSANLGVTWTPEVSGTTSIIWDIVYSPELDRFVAVGDDMLVYGE